MAPTTKTPVMVLQELTVQKGLPPPNFQIVYSISGTHDNRFDYQVCVAGITATGSGPSKQIGKHEAAHNALKLLEEIGLYNPAENPVAEFRPSLKDGSPLKSALNSIVELQNICLENKIPPPEFIEISSIGPAHAKEFTLQCRISSIVTESTANTKKLAKQLAARDMLDKVKNIMPELITESDMGKKKFLQEHEEVIAKYNFLNNVIPDKCVQVNDMPNTLKKLMVLKDIQYENLKEDLEERSEEALKRILEKLEVEVKTLKFANEGLWNKHLIK
ncbi:hypothetical protein GWI33_008854 [Rhynchophorus ferrugineus]|uniref:DRBM domain-containing protein n=1 Tax=Rhynchophorus ferrugineus TaxID=354439 RepID=A0A834IBS9_RHYFE|nr:hypothetical protein GWI33_008854 [Rhynchophorus ferrugineus]